jgi:hypothetical protein
MPNYQTFFKIIEEELDFETATVFMGRISRLAFAGHEVRKIETHMKGFVERIKKLPTRKEQAMEILSSYGGKEENKSSNRAGMVFKLLDGGTLDNTDYGKLVHQLLK